MRDGRRIHLVDVENLVGHAHLAREDVARCADAYRGLGVLGPRDLVVVGCHPAERLAVGLGWGGPLRIVGRRGPDGADLALMDVLAHERVDRRFADLVIASGDGAFAEPVRRLARRGLRVTVVAPVRSVGRRLRSVAGLALVPFPVLGRAGRDGRGGLVPAA
jgi:hypothetical protein